MGSQNKGIIIQKNNGFAEQRYYQIEKQWVHRIEVLQYRKTMGSKNRGMYNIEKQWVHRIEVL